MYSLIYLINIKYKSQLKQNSSLLRFLNNTITSTNLMRTDRRDCAYKKYYSQFDKITSQTKLDCKIPYSLLSLRILIQ